MVGEYRCMHAHNYKTVNGDTPYYTPPYYCYVSNYSLRCTMDIELTLLFGRYAENWVGTWCNIG